MSNIAVTIDNSASTQSHIPHYTLNTKNTTPTSNIPELLDIVTILI